jgi:hypothetical protein
MSDTRWLGLYRAIVSVPDALCPRSEPLHERIVFFECWPPDKPSHRLERLLAEVWSTDTSGWANTGWIYNVCPAHELLERRFNEDAPRDLALFETGATNGDFPNTAPNGVLYARRGSVDLFVRPELGQALAGVLWEVEILREAGAAKQSSGPRALP